MSNVFAANHKKYTNALCVQNAQLLLKLGHVVTIGLERVTFKKKKS
jgi:hypothetical protein